jgi:hypothetical protein
MKWKRSRKAQQESKNKDNHSNNNDDKSRDRSSSSTAQTTVFKEKVITNLSNSNFHSHLPPHPAISHQRHSLPGSSKDLPNGVEESYASNLMNRQQYNDGDDMIWRVV